MSKQPNRRSTNVAIWILLMFGLLIALLALPAVAPMLPIEVPLE